MGIKQNWIDENLQLLMMSIDSPWTWEELRTNAMNAFTEIRAVDHPVATLMDISRIGKLPAGNFLAQLQFIDANMPPNVYASVLVGAPYVVATFMNILTRIRPKAKEIVFFAASFDEAKAMIQQRYEELYPTEQL